MIISRTPLRISFVGGGTDFPRWYTGRYGCVVGAAIDKYVYVIVNPRFEGGIRVAYAGTEELVRPWDFVGHHEGTGAPAVDAVRHGLIREAMKLTGVTQDVEIVTVADVPGKGTGLGSSSAVTVGVLNALWKHRQGRQMAAEPVVPDCAEWTGEIARQPPVDAVPTPPQLAKHACQIELDILGKPIGKQDHYLCALGGVNCIEFLGDGQVVAEDLNPVAELEISREATRRKQLEPFCDNLLLFYLGTTRCADDILKEQDESTDVNERHLQRLADIARTARSLLLRADFNAVGELMATAWGVKKELTLGITDVAIDMCYQRAREEGALGGKVCGAGGGGFMLLYVPPDRQTAVREALSDLKELPFNFDYEGAKIIYAD